MKIGNITIYCPLCKGENVRLYAADDATPARVSIDELGTPAAQPAPQTVAVCQDCGYERTFAQGAA